MWGSLLGGIVLLIVRRARAAAGPPPVPHAPVWPPFEQTFTATVAPATGAAPVEPVEPVEAVEAVEPDEQVEPPRWVPPVDGACPDGFPVKANDRSKIFHVPGGRSYDRTIPERCYADPESAAADGYRAAKA